MNTVQIQYHNESNAIAIPPTCLEFFLVSARYLGFEVDVEKTNQKPIEKISVYSRKLFTQ
jgi:hypothetical protein